MQSASSASNIHPNTERIAAIPYHIDDDNERTPSLQSSNLKHLAIANNAPVLAAINAACIGRVCSSQQRGI